MSLTCGYSSPRSDGDANSQVTGARVQVPLGHEPLGHDAMLPALRLTGPRRADLNKLPNLRCLLTAELAAARRCRTAGSGAFSRRVWCCAEPARLGVNVAGLLRRRFFGACLAAAVPAGQGSLRVVRAGRLVRTGPDRPEGAAPVRPGPAASRRAAGPAGSHLRAGRGQAHRAQRKRQEIRPTVLRGRRPQDPPRPASNRFR
jgi:hypothetical protein